MGTTSAVLRPVFQIDRLAGILRRLGSLIRANENLDYFLYECRLTGRREDEFRPKIRNFILKTVKSCAELDELSQAGFDLSLDSPLTRRGLEKGAVAFLLFVDRELASRELVATNYAAKAAIDKYPYKVDFERREACASGVWTNPKFRGQGLHTYVFYRAYDYLRQNGVQVVRSIVWVNNAASQKAHARFAPDIKKYARGHYFRVLGLTFCWQTALK